MLHRLDRLQTLVAVVLLTLMAVLAGGAAMRESATFDEVAHLGAGVSYLQKLDYRMNEEHPPLAKMLAAAPLVIHGVRADYSDVSWTFSKGLFSSMLGEWSWGHQLLMRWNDPRSTLLWSRFPMLLLTLAFGWVLYAFGSRLGGQWGGLLCLACYVSYPAFLAFGPLILTDLAVTLFCVLSVWFFAEMWRTPNRATALRFGLALAAALLSKFSSGLLFFGFAGFILSLRWFPLADQPKDPDSLREWRRVRRKYLRTGVLWAALIVYATYFVISWNQPTSSLQRLGSGALALIFRRLLMPPWLYLRGLALFVLMSSRPTFILGHAYAHGVWFYFPVLFMLKSTLSFLALLVLAGLAAYVAKVRLRGTLLHESIVPAELQFHWRALWVFLAIFVAACLLSRLDLSIRHFMLPISLIILLLAPLPRMLHLLDNAGWRPARITASFVVLLACASVATAARAYPYYIPFLNSFSLGKPGYTLVNDSNLDWNQSLPEAEDFVRKHGLKDVLLGEYGFSDPSVYVSGARFWNCQQPSATDAGRWTIVSASLIEDGHNCLWLMNYPHEALAGGSMYALKLPPVIPAVGQQGGPPPESAFKSIGGAPAGLDMQQIFYDCAMDPSQLQPTLDRMMAQFAQTQNKH